MNPLPRFTESEILEEAAILRRQDDRSWARFERRIGRIFIRSMRIIAGVALFVGFSYCADSAYGELSKPFAAQSIVGIGGGLFMVFMAWLLITWAWSVAFGAGPTPSDEAQELRNRALQSLTHKRPAGMSIATPADPFQ